MTLSAALMSRASDHWCTPSEVLERVYRVGPIMLDPCSNDGSIVEAERSVRAPEDGLAVSWPRPGITYVNPPYSALRRWLQACAHHAMVGRGEVIALVPARTDTRAWQDYATTAAAVCFWRGRLRFLGGKHPAPFPSAVLYWGPPGKRGVFTAAFSDAGAVYSAWRRQSV